MPSCLTHKGMIRPKGQGGDPGRSLVKQSPVGLRRCDIECHTLPPIPAFGLTARLMIEEREVFHRGRDRP